MPQNILHVYT